MPTSKRRKSRDKTIKKTRGPGPHSYPVGEWLQAKGVTAEESEIVRVWDGVAEEHLQALDRKIYLRDLDEAYLEKAERER